MVDGYRQMEYIHTSADSGSKRLNTYEYWQETVSNIDIDVFLSAEFSAVQIRTGQKG